MHLDVTLIGSDKIEFSFPQEEYCYLFRNFKLITKSNYDTYDAHGRPKAIKIKSSKKLSFLMLSLI